MNKITIGLIALAWLGAGELPSKRLDLTNWKLTLPIGERSEHPTEIRQPALATFEDRNYFWAKEGEKGVTFRAHCGGITTENTKFPRSELREMTNQGSEQASWGTNDGQIHTMTMNVAFTHLPVAKPHAACAQIHDGDDDVLMVRLEGKKLLIERNSNGDIVLDSNYKLGTPFELKIQAKDGQIQVWHNATLKMNWKVKRAKCFFKAGCYTLSNPQRGDAPDAYGESVIYQLLVEHQK